MKNILSPVHPGEVLAEEFLKPLEVSQYRLALEIEVPPRRINEIVLGKRSITADTAVRLARFFGTSEMFWMNLQSRFELDRLVDQERQRISPIATRPIQRKKATRRRIPAGSLRKAK